MLRLIPAIPLAMTLGALLTFSPAQGAIEKPCDTSRDKSSAIIKDVFCVTAGDQASLLANIARDTVKGSQISLMANIASTQAQHSQVSFGFNYAREVRRQFSWNVNIAQEVEKLQFGSWNVADTVHGAQIGFVNISRHIEGTSLGLLTLSKNGLLHINTSTEETGMAHLTFASGHRLYTAFDFGFTPDDDDHPFSVGIGLGRHWEFGTAYLETELFAHMIANRHTTEDQWKHHDHHGSFDDDGLNHLFQAKVRIGQPLIAGIGIYAGLSYNALVHGDNEPLIHPWSESFTHAEDRALFWPGVEVGLRFGR